MKDAIRLKGDAANMFMAGLMVSMKGEKALDGVQEGSKMWNDIKSILDAEKENDSPASGGANNTGS